MRHVRFDIAFLRVGGSNVRLKVGYLLVAALDDADEPQWEVLAYSLDSEPLPQAVHRVEIDTLAGATLSGDAALVRSVSGAHVLRGAGALDGFAGFDDGGSPDAPPNEDGD